MDKAPAIRTRFHPALLAAADNWEDTKVKPVLQWTGKQGQPSEEAAVKLAFESAAITPRTLPGYVSVSSVGVKKTFVIKGNKDHWWTVQV